MDEFALEDGAIRIGLGRIRELTVRARASIYRNRPFTGLHDLIARTAIGRAELENLIRAGGLDFVGRPRRQILFETDMMFEQAKKLRDHAPLFGYDDPTGASPVLRDRPPERMRDEWSLLKLSTGPHPVACVRSALAGEPCLPSTCIPDHIGKRVCLCGIPAAARRLRTRRGGVMCFMTLSDEYGLFELTIASEIYSRCREVIVEHGAAMLRVEGRVESDYDALSVAVDHIRPVLPRGEPAPDPAGPDWRSGATARAQALLAGKHR
jgi:DNA polymerase-3 subunit alpha